MAIYKICDVPYEHIHFGKLRKGIDTYMMSTYLQASSDTLPEKLFVQTDKVILHSSPYNDKNELENYIEMVTEDSSLETMIKKVESHVLDVLKTNIDVWFTNKDIDDTFLESGLTSSVLKGNRFRFRIMEDVQIYGSNRETKSLEDLKKGSVIKSIIQMSGLWFTASRWGVTWKVNQIKMNQSNIKKLRECMFPDDEDHDEYDEDVNVLKVPPSCQ